MKIYLIRHGQTDWNVQKKIQGSSDIELNETGIRQAEELSLRLIEQKYQFDKIYTSPKKRALTTAQIISERIKTEYEIVEDFSEMNFGDWEGLSWPVVQTEYPFAYRKWHENRRYVPTPHGESYQQLLQRVLGALDKILEENFNNIAIVSHSAIIMSLQCYLSNIPFEEMLQFKATNASILEIESEQLISMKKYA